MVQAMEDCIDGALFHDDDYRTGPMPDFQAIIATVHPSMREFFREQMANMGNNPYHSREPSLSAARIRFPTWASVTAKVDQLHAFLSAQQGNDVPVSKVINIVRMK